jgi:CheY-like chemotaxis protein
MSRILITDDSLLQRKTLSAIVQNEGHTVETATNGREALEIIQANPPDCLLLDMLMPEVDGIQVLETLKANDCRLPVIVLTADIQEWMKTRCLELGAAAFLNKPVKQDRLCAALKQILEHSPNQEAPCS